jgi:hypothetical protein
MDIERVAALPAGHRLQVYGPGSNTAFSREALTVGRAPSSILFLRPLVRFQYAFAEADRFGGYFDEFVVGNKL